jgi:hypothetical protein
MTDNNLIGPIEKAHWVTLKLLNKSIRRMKEKDPEKFRDAIDKEKELYKGFLTPYLSRKSVNEKPYQLGEVDLEELIGLKV